HHVVLAWFRDVLEILTPHNIGYALWNFRGSFGIVDSGRTDVAYEDWHGHKLDRAFLELLQAF
ncbi:glycosyl hydrolase family 5, partial [candidate division KSB1 bacterium]